MPGHATSSTSPHQRLFSLLAAERGSLWTALTFSLAIGVLTLAVPVATQALVNTVAFGNLLQPVAVLGLIVFALLIAAALLQLMRFRVVELLQRRIFVRQASEAVHRLLHSTTGALKLHNGPEIVNRFLDIATVQKASAILLVDGLSVATQTIAAMALLAVYHPVLLAFDGALLIAIAAIIYPVGRGAVSTAVQESKAKYALVGWMEEIARSPGAFRGADGLAFATAQADSLVRSYLRYRAAHFRVLLRQFIGSLGVQALANAALLGVGGMLVIDRQLTLGQLVAAELVVATVLAGVAKLAKHLESFYDLLSSLDKLGSLVDLPAEESGTEPFQPDSPAALSINGPGLNVVIPAGSRVAITGPSGSGKSTLLDAICGYRRIPGTSIQWNGADIRYLRLTDLRSRSALLREIEIFHGSILDNVRVGRQISSTGVQQALQQAGVWNTVESLPDGVQAILATGGHPLSEGQRHAVMIARAIAGEPRLLVIDEVLDRVQDHKDRDLLTNLLFSRQAPWTLVVVTARPDLLKLCDTIVELPSLQQQEVT
ncbi:MAG: ATP-binding cassette domain-containing protein [Acidobacteria bacterium]|nr:ATP-binding cassette domain-containing protein [Acidobacteriota bacterium]